MFDTPHRFVDLDFARVATWTVGRGPDLVFVHGWPVWSATYRHLVPRLQDRFTCHLLDLPGAGRTQTHDRDAIDLRRHVDTVAATVDALGLDRYAMLAFDSGGLITRGVAAARPEQVTGLVLGNTEMPGEMSRLMKQMVRFGPTRLGQLAMTTALRVPRLRSSRYGFGTCFMDASLVDGDFTRLFIEPMLRSRDVRREQFAFVDNLDPAILHELPEVHAAVRCPVQMIWGKRDPWFPLRSAEAHQGDFQAGAELEVLDGKLFVHEEQPTRFAEVTTAFLEGRALAA